LLACRASGTGGRLPPQPSNSAVRCLGLAGQLRSMQRTMPLVQTGIGNIKGASTVALLLLAFGGIASMTVWQQDVPRPEKLTSEKGTLVGFETKHSRYSSYEYLLMRINGRDERLRLWACVSELKRLPLETEIDVLRMDETLFELAQAGNVACSYTDSAQALGKFQAGNRFFVGLALAAATCLVALLAWTNWRTRRHLDKLASARQSLG